MDIIMKKNFIFNPSSLFTKNNRVAKPDDAKEEYFTYDEVVFINDMKDEVEKLKRIESKVNADPKNMEALSIYTEILFDKTLVCRLFVPN